MIVSAIMQEQAGGEPMRQRILLMAIAAAAIILGAGNPGARAAETSDDGYARRMFAGGVAAGKSYACFVRRYDARHLAQHPLQKVSVMKLLVTAEHVPESAGLSYSFRLGVNFRDRPGDFDSSGECGRAQGEGAAAKVDFNCSVDCDGGGITVALSGKDKALIVRLEEIRIWKGKDYDESAATELKGGADDKVFRLDRAKAEECAALVTDRKELAAMRHK